MNQKVLLVTYYWPPGGGPGVQRILKFAKYLPLYRIDPIILTVANPTYPIRDPSLAEEIPEGVPVYKSRTVEPFALYRQLRGGDSDTISPTVELKSERPAAKIGSWIRANIFIPDARAGWFFTASRQASKLVEKFNIDTVITTGPPHSTHFTGRYLQKEKGTRWLADFRDPWSEIYYNQLLPRTSWADSFDRHLEQRILREADEVIVVSRLQAEEFRTLVERGYQVITNGFDPHDFPSGSTHDFPKGSRQESREPSDLRSQPSSSQPVRSSPSLSKQPGPEQPFLIRHIGNIGEAAVPEAFCRAVASLTPSLPLKVEFIGNVHHRLRERIRQLGLEKTIFIRSYLPHLKALEEMCEADLLLLSIPDVTNIRHHIPGKLFEYIGSGRPILLLGPTDGESARLLLKEQAGQALSFHDESSIRTSIQAFARGEIQRPDFIRSESHPFSRIELTRRLARLIREKPYQDFPDIL